MKKKIIFLDIDGTLVPLSEEIPASAIEAVQTARKNGHLVFLCTGRSKPEVYKGIWDIGFDGLIGAGGGYIEMNDEVIFHQVISDDIIRNIVDYFEENNFDYILETNSGLYGSKNLEPRMDRMMYGDIDNDAEAKAKKENNPHPFVSLINFDGTNMYRDDVNKIGFLENPDIVYETVKNKFEDVLDVIPCTVPVYGKESGELLVPGVHKANAIEFLLNYIQMDKADTIAIGDGLNDKEMLEYCEVGIAMGNAHEDLKAIADDITADLDDDGLYKAFKKYELI